MTRLKSFFLIGPAVVALSMGLYAQQLDVGSITGSVTDSSGAVIPDARVVALNTATGITRTTFTTSAGIYHIDRLQIGRYTVTVTKAGFRTEERTNVAVIAGQTFTVDIGLQVGPTIQTLTVSGTPPVINATDTMQGTTRTVAEIAELPLVMEGDQDIEAISAVQTMAGVNYSILGNGGATWQVISRADINGVNGGGFGYEIDGLEAGPGEPEQAEDFMSPNPDAVEEIRVTTSTDASQGFNAGVNINEVLKSGTNQLHGEAYWYNRNAAFEGRNWFLPTTSKDDENQVGFSLGGPVYIPKVYNGRNKTFFFLAAMGFRYETAFATQGTPQAVYTVPTAAEKNGDFSGLLGPQIDTDALGRPVYQGEIYDPLTTRQLPDGSFIRDPFAYQGQLNVIPPNRMSAISTFFQKGYEPPTLPGISSNWAGPYSTSYLPDQHYNVKIDHQIGDKQHLTVGIDRQFGWGFPNQDRPPGCYGDHAGWIGWTLYTDPIIANSGLDDCRDQYRYRIMYTATVKSNLLLSFRAGVTRDPRRNQLDVPAQIFNGACEAGLKNGLNTGLNSGSACYTPSVHITNVSGFGAEDTQFPEEDHSERVPVSTDLSWPEGKHLFSFGAQYVAANFIGNEEWEEHGHYNFSNNETGLPGTPDAPQVGAGYASYLLGAVDNALVGTALQSYLVTGEGAIYAQDKWQVTPKLTVNYGLRWEVTTPAHEHDNRISSFDPSIPNPGAGGRLGALEFWGIGPGRNGLTQVGPYYLKAFAPKIGLAYAITPKTVFRANFGISYFPYWGKWLNSAGNFMPLDGFADTITPTSTNSGLTPAFYWDNGFPDVFPTTYPIVDPSLDNNQTATFVDTNHNRPPMVEDIGAEIERQLPGQILLRAAYVGNLTHRLYATSNLDQLPLKYLSLGSLLNDDISSPQAIAAGIPVPYPGFTGPVAQALTPYPQYLAVNDVGGQLANSDYHALQINVQRHFGSLTFLANATLSKEMDMVGYPCACDPTHSSLNVPLEMAKTAYAVSGMNVAKAMNFSWIWDLPVGPGKHFLGHTSKVANALLGNWQLSAMQSYQSGMPFGLSTNEGIPSLEGVPPDLNQGVPIKAVGGCGNVHPGVSGKDLYLNPAAFRDPAPFTMGNTFELPTVMGCGYYNEDLGLGKSFRFGEGRRVTVGAMATNLFNRHQFVGLDTNTDDPSFGQFSGNSYPRSVQLYMKVTF